MKYLLLLLLTSLSVSCISQNKKATVKDTNKMNTAPIEEAIGQYVVNVFEDTKGHLWFGTLEKGVAKYDGESLRYFTTADGLPSNRVTGIVEDTLGNLWFGTGSGISKYNGETFLNFSEKDGLCSDMTSSLLIDSRGILWIGTWKGVCYYDGNFFSEFHIPYPEVETKLNPDTKDWVTTIFEDASRNIWIARDGTGAVKYDGNDFTFFLKKNGLYSNGVTAIVEDNSGTFWFGARVAEKDNPDPSKRSGKGGVTTFDGTRFGHFPQIEGFTNGDVYEIYKDNSKNLWIATTSNGVYKYDGESFVNYDIPISIMSIKQDKKGNLWLGGAGGLYRINTNGNSTPITTTGPWK